MLTLLLPSTNSRQHPQFDVPNFHDEGHHSRASYSGYNVSRVVSQNAHTSRSSRSRVDSRRARRTPMESTLRPAYGILSGRYKSYEGMHGWPFIDWRAC